MKKLRIIKIIVVALVGFYFLTAEAAIDMHKDLAQINSSVKNESKSELNPTLAAALFADGRAIPQPNKKLVYFWASWCTVCGEKLTKVLPELAKRRTDVSVETINLDEDEERVAHFIQKQAIKLPVFFDRTGRIKEEQNITAVPHWMTFKRDPKSGEWVKLASEDAFDLEKVEKSLK